VIDSIAPQSWQPDRPMVGTRAAALSLDPPFWRAGPSGGGSEMTS
jgi:hypothetical protein